MKQKGNFVLRKLLDEYVLVPCKETAEQMNQVITLSEIAAYIPDVDTADQLADLVSREYNEPKEDVVEDVNMVIEKFEQMGLLEK